jgi:hypothetical protein
MPFVFPRAGLHTQVKPWDDSLLDPKGPGLQAEADLARQATQALDFKLPGKEQAGTIYYWEGFGVRLISASSPSPGVSRRDSTAQRLRQRPVRGPAFALDKPPDDVEEHRRHDADQAHAEAICFREVEPLPLP